MPALTKFHIRKKIAVFTVCLIASALLWVLNDLNRIQTTTLQIPIRFTGLPYNMVPVNSIPTSIEATIDATGFSLLWQIIIPNKNVIEIPLQFNSGTIQPNKNYFVNLTLYNKIISKSIGSKIKVRKFFPDTFSIHFAKKHIKKVPVKLFSTIQYQKEFYISGKIKIDPDSVIISGAKEKINKIDSVYTQMVQLKSLNKTYINSVDLQEINGANYNINKVKITIPVEQFTEKEISLKVNSMNVPANYELNLIPTIITLKLLVPISTFNNINKSQFKVSAPFPYTKSLTNKILLQISQKPNFIKVLEIKPTAVEYKIKSID